MSTDEKEVSISQSGTGVSVQQPNDKLLSNEIAAASDELQNLRTFIVEDEKRLTRELQFIRPKNNAALDKAIEDVESLRKTIRTNKRRADDLSQTHDAIASSLDKRFDKVELVALEEKVSVAVATYNQFVFKAESLRLELQACERVISGVKNDIEEANSEIAKRRRRNRDE